MAENGVWTEVSLFILKITGLKSSYEWPVQFPVFIDSLKYSPRFISDPPTYEDRKKNTTKKKNRNKE